MLSDNLEFQEAVIYDIKDRANEVLALFPVDDGNKARIKLTELDQRFLLVKERLQRRLEEMMKSSVDWHEFECGLKSCFDWVQRAEERLVRDLRENEVDNSRLKVSKEIKKLVCLFFLLCLCLNKTMGFCHKVIFSVLMSLSLFHWNHTIFCLEVSPAVDYLPKKKTKSRKVVNLL